MRKAIPLRADCTGDELRKLARTSDDANQTRRLPALASIYDGGSRPDAATLGGVTLQIVRDRVFRFNAADPDGLINREAPGQLPILTGEPRAALFPAVSAFAVAPTLVLFAERDQDGLAENLWFTLDIGRAALGDKALECFGALGRDHDLLLAEWGWGFTAGLGETERLRRYLATRVERFGRCREQDRPG